MINPRTKRPNKQTALHSSAYRRCASLSLKQAQREAAFSYFQEKRNDETAPTNFLLRLLRMKGFLSALLWLAVLSSYTHATIIGHITTFAPGTAATVKDQAIFIGI